MTEALRERLDILKEEAAEVVQAACKAARHGIDNWYKDQPTNRESLHAEVGDLLHAIEMCYINGDLDREKVENYKNLKRERIKSYLHHEENKI